MPDDARNGLFFSPTLYRVSRLRRRCNRDSHGTVARECGPADPDWGDFSGIVRPNGVSSAAVAFGFLDGDTRKRGRCLEDTIVSQKLRVRTEVPCPLVSTRFRSRLT